MAKFNQQLPNDLIKTFEELAIATPKMMGEMTKAGAETVEKIVRNNLSKSFKSTDRLSKCLFVSKTYRTPSDDSINNKVMIYGYMDAEKKKPAPLVAMAREYGTSRGESRKPFFRKSFRKTDIENAMKQVEEKYLPKG
jgi:hypothetical protein